MKNTHPEKNHLIIAAARGIIGSSLSPEELTKLCFTLKNEPNAAAALSSIIASFLEISEEIFSAEYHTEEHEKYENDEILEILNEIKRRRLTKAYISSIILEFDSRLKNSIDPMSMSMSDIIYAFYAMTSNRTFSYFKDFIFNEKNSDPYLSNLLGKK